MQLVKKVSCFYQRTRLQDTPKIFLENLECLHAKQRTWVIRDYVIKMKKNLTCYNTVMLKHWKLLLIAKIKKLSVRSNSYIWLNIFSNIYLKVERKHFLFLTYVHKKNRTEEFLNENFSNELIFQTTCFTKPRQAFISRALLLPYCLHTFNFSLKELKKSLDHAKYYQSLLTQ